MGDISELRGLVTIVSFLGLLVLLMLQIPSALYTAGNMRELDVPGQWEGIDIQSFQETWNSTSIASLDEQFDIGGRNLWWQSSNSGDRMLLWHRYGFLLLLNEDGKWYDRQGIQQSVDDPFYGQIIGATTLNSDYSTYGDVRFIVKFELEAKFQVSVLFDFNETTYSSPSLAWDNDDLNVLVGINFDDINTSYNAWDLIAMLLFFQLPTISPILNAIIAIPIWVAVAYLAYVLIIKVIPLIAGG